MTKYPLYGLWTPLDVVALVTSCLNALEMIRVKDENHKINIKFDQARKEYNKILEALSQFDKQIDFWDITENRMRYFLRIDDEFYTENHVLKRAKIAEWRGLSNKQYLDALIKEQESVQGADKFLKDMQSIVNKPTDRSEDEPEH